MVRFGEEWRWKQCRGRGSPRELGRVRHLLHQHWGFETVSVLFGGIQLAQNSPIICPCASPIKNLRCSFHCPTETVSSFPPSSHLGRITNLNGIPFKITPFPHAQLLHERLTRVHALPLFPDESDRVLDVQLPRPHEVRNNDGGGSRDSRLTVDQDGFVLGETGIDERSCCREVEEEVRRRGVVDWDLEDRGRFEWGDVWWVY